MQKTKGDKRTTVVLACWIAVYSGLWTVSQWTAQRGLSTSVDLFNYYNRTTLEALKLAKDPKQPLPKGWFREDGLLVKKDATTRNLCEVLKTKPTEFLHCDPKNRVYFE